MEKDAKEAIICDMAVALRVALAAVRPDAYLEWKHMFGGAGFYAGGRMFAAWFGEGLALKLPEDARADLLQIEGAAPTWAKDYVETPAVFLDNPTLLESWVERSLDYVTALEAKKHKRR